LQSIRLQSDVDAAVSRFISELSVRNDFQNAGQYYLVEYTENQIRRFEAWIPRQGNIFPNQLNPGLGIGGQAFDPGFGLGLADVRLEMISYSILQNGDVSSLYTPYQFWQRCYEKIFL